MKHIVWADQRVLQGNISYIVLTPGQYLDIAREWGQYYHNFHIDCGHHSKVATIKGAALTK